MNRKKEAKKAALYSFLLTGWGQFYNKKKKLGIKLMSYSILGLIVCVIGVYLILKSYIFYTSFTNTIYYKSGIGIMSIGFIVIISVGLYSALEAYNTVLRKEESSKDEKKNREGV